MRRLSGMDASFLYLETPSSHMHVASAAVFDTSEQPLSWTYFLEHTVGRLDQIPIFRQRLAEIPFGIHHPLWVDDPEFDIEYHVRRAALPAPGGLRELAQFSADFVARPLDRAHPLWEMYVVEGLEHGHTALVTKTHHAAIDGVSGADITVALLDIEPDPPPAPPPEHPWRPERLPSDVERVTFALSSLSRQPLGLARAVRRSARGALKLGRLAADRGSLLAPAPFQAPRSSLNAALTPHRKVGYAQAPLAEVKEVKNALGGTVNDVVLAICAGALRSYFIDRAETVEDPLVAMVPISVRTDDQRGQLGNRVAAMLVSLATLTEDPEERLSTIVQGTIGAKEQYHAIGADTLADWAEFAAPALAARAARLYSRMRLADRHRPLFNLTISNVPGPSFPLYVCGQRMVADYPLGPIFDGAAMNITVMSYMGSMFFGVVACREAVGDVWLLAHQIEESLDELTKVAAAR